MDALGWFIRVAVVVLGKLLAGLLGVRRAADAKRREMSAVALAEAWRKIVRAGARRGPEELGLLDEALGDIQLFGSLSHVRRAAAVAQAINAGEPYAPLL